MRRLPPSQAPSDSQVNPERFDSSNSTIAHKLSVASKQTDTQSHLPDLTIRPSAGESSSSSSIFSEPFNGVFVTAGGSSSVTRTSSASQHTAHSTSAGTQPSSRPLSHSASQHSSRQPSPMHNAQKSPSRQSFQHNALLYRSTSSRKPSSVHARHSDGYSPSAAQALNSGKAYHTPGIELADVENHAAPAPQVLAPNSLEMEGQAPQMAQWGNEKRATAKGAPKHSLRAMYDTRHQNTDNMATSPVLSASHPSRKSSETSRELDLARRSRADSVHNLFFAPSTQINRSSSLRGTDRLSFSSSRSIQSRKSPREHDHAMAVAAIEGRAWDPSIASQAPLSQNSDVSDDSARREGWTSPIPQRRGRVPAARVDTRWAGRPNHAGPRGGRHKAARPVSAGFVQGKRRDLVRSSACHVVATARAEGR
jgi:hypothetical protein